MTAHLVRGDVAGKELQRTLYSKLSKKIMRISGVIISVLHRCERAGTQPN